MSSTDKSTNLQQNFDQENLLHRMTNRIRRSLDLQEVLATTVEEVRSFLRTDRVKVYRFDADDNGEVIAESIHQQRLPSLLGLHFPASDIPPEARELFLSARQRSIVDVPKGEIGLSPLQSSITGKSLQTENIDYRHVDPCHIQYLMAMGVQSSLVLPIIHEDLTQEALPQLWGLLISHHSTPRTILKRELKVLQQVADQVAIAIAQSNLLTHARAKQQREAIVNRVTTLLHTLPTIQVQAALETVITTFDGAGGRLYIEQSEELYTWGDQPQLLNKLENSLIEQHPVWQNWLTKSQNGEILAIANLYKEPRLRVLSAAFRSTQIRGLLLIPLRYRQNFIGVLSIFRNEFDTEILWAGHRDQNQQQLLPQISFDVFRDQKKGQAPEWKAEEIELAQALSHQFSMAIQQHQTYQQVQSLNVNLKRQVQEQTAELQKSLQLAKALKHITDQIRATLDFKTILQTIVREVRKLLVTDRVLIYQLLDSNNGKVIVEDVNHIWQSILDVEMPSECFPDEYARLYLRGRVRAINNVSAASLSACHQEFLQCMQVQANLIVPIKMGTQLWGLLVAHQCNAPRNWQDAEIELLQQLGDQAVIAIGQAQLYEQSRSAEVQARAKTVELEQTLDELKHTQTQLIQTEKMSSLGQLVAGVAHEINNPVNFIFGNLAHATEYTTDLLELISLYQLHYPQINKEIDSKAKEMDLEFLAEDLPKIMSSMQIGAERICSIVLSLRNFSRLDHSEMKPVNLHEGIDSTLLILQHRLKANADFSGVEVIKNYQELPLVECYAGQMNQVFMNILSNAIDALVDNNRESREMQVEEISVMKFGEIGHENSSPFLSNTIRISTKLLPEKSHVVICIGDNGSGMSEDVKKRIFDPFFTTKPVGKGTGLGLAISYQIIVQKHGGMMKCISEPGKGTEFWIEIPLQQT
ncbi:MAG: GAF domain-containing sensor histidine kinase [Hassallia sp.]